MTVITPNEGFWAPSRTDLAVPPADIATFARQFDGDYVNWITEFAKATQQPAFLCSTTTQNSGLVTSAATVATFQTTNFNQGGSTIQQFFGTSWIQPAGDGQAWWLIGCALAFAIVSGGVTATSYYGAAIDWQDFDPTTRTTVTGQTQGNAVETNTSGNDAINILTLVKFLGDGRASVSWAHNDPGSGSTKAIAVGSLFYGIRLGDATS